LIDKLETPPAVVRALAIIAAINAQIADITPADRQVKYAKMAASPFVFFRGTNHLFWADFAGDPRLDQFGGPQTRTWLQGDLHAENFGAFSNDEGEVVYDINDFDEAVIADYQYDLWRMAVSIVLVAREQGDLSRKEQKQVVAAFSRAYLDTVAGYCARGGERDTIFDRRNTFGRLDNLLKKVEKKKTRAEMLADWTADGRFLVEEKPDKLAVIPDALRQEIIAAMAPYRTQSLAKRPAGAEDNANYFQVRDVARRLSAGTGSLGTPRFYVLIHGDNEELKTDRILDVKKQARPVPYQFLPAEDQREYDFFTKAHPGRDAVWHAAAYRAMAKDTDDLLGWMALSDGYYSVRERSFTKETLDLAELDSQKRFAKLAQQWGMIIATDHARAMTDYNDDFPPADLRQELFRSKRDEKAFKCRVAAATTAQEQPFTRLVQEVAFNYAEQVTTDWATFKEAYAHSLNQPSPP
jgi:uncharacterized protein (DUF2252 family)